MKNIFAILLLCSTIVCCACGSEDEKEMITPVLEVGSKNVYVGESAVTRGDFYNLQCGMVRFCGFRRSSLVPR